MEHREENWNFEVRILSELSLGHYAALSFVLRGNGQNQDLGLSFCASLP